MGDTVGGAQANGSSNGHPSSYAAKHNLPSHFIGGNELSKAPPSKVKDFVTEHDGHTVITNVSCTSPLPQFTALLTNHPLPPGPHCK